MVRDRGGPSRHGRALGRLLASWATRGQRPGEPIPCVGCAFREGTLANECAATIRDALSCVTIDPETFGCHKRLVDGLPTRQCAGAVAAARFAEENFEAATEGLSDVAAMISDGSPDEVRASFELWLDRHDPERVLNNYERDAIRIRTGDSW